MDEARSHYELEIRRLSDEQQELTRLLAAADELLKQSNKPEGPVESPLPDGNQTGEAIDGSVGGKRAEDADDVLAENKESEPLAGGSMANGDGSGRAVVERKPE